MSTISGSELSGLHLGKYVRIEGEGYIAAGKILKVQHEYHELLPGDPARLSHAIYLHHGNSGQWFNFESSDRLSVADTLAEVDVTEYTGRTAYSPAAPN